MSLAGAYRAALVVYPRSFRAEYGADMVALFEQQLRDEHRLRVCARTAVDLAITAPTTHLEAHMQRNPALAVAIAFLVAGTAVAIAGGGPVGIAVGVGLAALGVVALRRSRPTVTVAGRWWKLLLAGIVLLGALAAVTTATGELSEGWWLAAMGGFLTALALVASGAALGVGRWRSSVRTGAG